MKADITFSIKCGISMSLLPETNAEAALLVRLGMNGCSKTNKVLTVYANSDTILGYVGLRFRSDRAWEDSCEQRTRINAAP